MPQLHRPLAPIVLTSVLALTAAPLPAAARPMPSPGSTGGAPVGGVVPTPKHKRQIPHPPRRHGKGTWLRHVVITEYWPAPESWFVGAPVKAPGLPGRHRIDWLYSASGVSMEGDGIGLDGHMYRIDALGRGGWVTRVGKPTFARNGFSAGAPYWRAGGFWRGPGGTVTFPLLAGGWSAGVGLRYVPPRGVTFAAGGTSRLHFWRSIAVDPDVIPLGSRVYIPAYRHDGHGGWFVAQDTGSAINGAHVDVYRSPPRSPADGGQKLTGRRVFVIRPRRASTATRSSRTTH